VSDNPVEVVGNYLAVRDDKVRKAFDEICDDLVAVDEERHKLRAQLAEAQQLEPNIQRQVKLIDELRAQLAEAQELLEKEELDNGALRVFLRTALDLQAAMEGGDRDI
jgi:uncharacterized membrane protein